MTLIDQTAYLAAQLLQGATVAVAVGNEAGILPKLTWAAFRDIVDAPDFEQQCLTSSAQHKQAAKERRDKEREKSTKRQAKAAADDAKVGELQRNTRDKEPALAADPAEPDGVAADADLSMVLHEHNESVRSLEPDSKQPARSSSYARNEQTSGHRMNAQQSRYDAFRTRIGDMNSGAASATNTSSSVSSTAVTFCMSCREWPRELSSGVGLLSQAATAMYGAGMDITVQHSLLAHALMDIAAADLSVPADVATAVGRTSLIRRYRKKTANMIPKLGSDDDTDDE
jgi:hypothetical protein